ncbi:F-box protein [Trifolium repens]|nr:F-box protein [Trifolium repens]
MFAFFELELAGTILFEGVDDNSNVIVNHGASMIMNWTPAQEKDVLQQVAVKVFSFVDDPRDLIRASAVCSSWGDFVIENGLCKKLCLRIIPEVSGAVYSIEVDNVIEPDSDMLERYYTDWEFLKRNHKVYALLAFGLTRMRNNCISKNIYVTYPNHLKEGTVKTLEPASETHLYELCSKICLVTEIHVHTFKAKAIRVRFGYHKNQMEMNSEPFVLDSLTHKMLYNWTYTSPVFPMSQENNLQQLKLPQPVMCIGGMMLLELYERDHKQEKHNLFIHPVQVVGRTISPSFIVWMLQGGRCNLIYFAKTTVRVVTAD